MLSGLGKLKDVEVKLYVNPHAKGAVHKQRRISLPLKTNLMRFLTSGTKWI